MTVTLGRPPKASTPDTPAPQPTPEGARVSEAPKTDRLRLTAIRDYVAWTGDEATAWFRLDPTLWGFESDHVRMGHVLDAARRNARLTGHDLHSRVTYRPQPIDVWAQRLDENSPAANDDVFYDWLDEQQQQKRKAGTAEKVVYLGVALHGRSSWQRFLDAVGRGERLTAVEHALREAEEIAASITDSGMGAVPVEQAELEWLVHRSVAMGLPSPALTVNVRGELTTEDLAGLTHGIVAEPVPFGRTVRLVDTREDSLLPCSHCLGPDGVPTGTVAAEEPPARPGRRPVQSPPVPCPLCEGTGSVARVRYVCALALGRTEEVDVIDPELPPWQAATDALPFPVEWSSRYSSSSGHIERVAVEKQLQRLRDQQEHHEDHDVEAPLALSRAAEQAVEVEDRMASASEVASTSTYGWHTLYVTGATEREALDRARRVVALYARREWKVEHVRQQWARYRSAIPGEPWPFTDHKRLMPNLYLAAGLPTTTYRLGDGRGAYLGFTVQGTRTSVDFDTHAGMEERDESGFTPIGGRPGCGKSTLLADLADTLIVRRILTTFLDPSADSRLAKALAALYPHLVEFVDLLEGPDGILGASTVVPVPARDAYPSDEEWQRAVSRASRERRSLLIENARGMLTADLYKHGRTMRRLRHAYERAAAEGPASLWALVHALEANARDESDELDREIASALRDVSDAHRARLLFDRVDPEAASEQDVQSPTFLALGLNNLALPKPGSAREEWTEEQALGLSLFGNAVHYSTARVYGRPRHERKAFLGDELHYMIEWEVSRALWLRFGADSRGVNTFIGAATQIPGTFLSLKNSNNVGSVFMGALKGEDAAGDGVELLGRERGIGLESILTGLPMGEGRPKVRDFVANIGGTVGRFRVDPRPSLLAAVDTTPGRRDKPAGIAVRPADVSVA